MASADINRIMDNLRVRLPGAIDDTIRLELFNALNEFFQGSNLWQEEIELNITAGTTNYDLSPSTNARVVRLMGLRNSNDLPVRGAIDIKTDELELFETPTQATSFYATVALTIKDPVNSEGFPVVPAWIVGIYQPVIIDGTLSRLMSQPAKPYTNNQLAIVHERRFLSAIGLARAEAQRRYSYGAQSWRFPQSFNRRKTYR